MIYAQRSYSQLQGINGRYPISVIGCFLVSFCNLENDFNVNIAPDVLDNFFKQRGYYVDVDDGVRDDLNWDTITKYDGLTKVVRTVDHGTAQTAGWPDSDKAIVRFYYRSSQTGQMTYHFCKVAVAGAHTIIDSYDGKLKASPYGEPTAWATYSHDVPQAVSVAPTGPPYALEPIARKEVILNKNTNRYGLNHATFNDIAADVLAPAAKGSRFFTSTVIRHQCGESYYSQDNSGYNVANGFNVKDCDDYTPPPPVIDPIPVEAPKPQTVVDYVPVGLPSSYSEYTLSTTIKYYATAQMALHDIKPVSTINRGKYLLYRSQDGMDCIVKDKGGIQYWINPADNVKEQSMFDEPLPAPLPVQPEPPKLPEIVIQPETTEPAQPQPDDLVVNGPNVWKSQTEYLFDDGLPITLQSTNSIPVKIKALDGKLPTTIDLPAHRKLDIIKRFPYNGVWYYQDTMLSDAGRFYALPSAMFPDPFETDQKLATLDINRDGDVNFSDFVDYGSKTFKSGVAVINTVARIVASKNVQNTKKVMDVIRKSAKKDRTK